MKFKKVMLVALILLAVLTIGAVGASDDADFNETLTVDNVEEVSIDAPSSEDAISDGGDGVIAASEDDIVCDGNSTSGGGDFPIVDVNSTKMNPGMSVNVHDTQYGQPTEIEITFSNVASGTVSVCVDNAMTMSVMFSEGHGQLNLPALNVGEHTVAVSYAGDDLYSADMITASFQVLSNGNSTGGNSSTIIINGDDRFAYWYQSHESASLGDDVVLHVGWMDVNEGTLALTVSKDEFSRTFNVNVEDKEEYEWKLNDLGLENLGMYRFTLTYNGATIIADFSFQLMYCNIEEYKDENVYVDYPFDVIRIYEQPNRIELYVDGNDEPSQPGDRQSPTGWYPTAWNLDDLGITSPGEYGILIMAYDDEDLVETFSMTLNVTGFDENEYRIFTNYEGIHDFDGDAPVVYLYCPVGSTGDVSVLVNGELLEDVFAVDAGNMISWTLSDLGIDQNGDYNMIVKDGSDEEIAQTDLNVYHLNGGNYYLFINAGGIVINENSSDYEYNREATIAGIILNPDTEDGYFRVYDGNQCVFSTRFGDDGWHSENGNPKFVIQLRNLNLNAFKDGDEVKFTFVDGEGNEVEEFTRTVLIHINDEYMKFYQNSETSEDDYYIYIHDNREFRTDIDYEEYDGDADVGGIILRPNTIEGRFVIFDGQTEIFSRNIVGDSDEWHFDDNGNLKYVVYFYMLNLTGVEDGDEITWAFFDREENEVEDYTRNVKIQINDGTVKFYNDEEEDESFINQDAIITNDDDKNYNPDAVVAVFTDTSIRQITICLRDIETFLFNRTISEDDFNEGSYAVLLKDLNLNNVEDRDIIRFVSFDGEGNVIEDFTRDCSIKVTDDYIQFYQIDDEVFLAFYSFYGNLTTGNLNDMELMGWKPNGNFIEIDSPNKLDELTISINGAEFTRTYTIEDMAEEYDYSTLSYIYTIALSDDIKNELPQNQTVTFNYVCNDANVTQKRIRYGDYLYKIITPDDVADLFAISIADGELQNLEDVAVTFNATGNANRQSIYIELCGGYFCVYVDDVKVEDLGRFVRIDHETELELFRLCGHEGAWPELCLTLENIGITESGTYNIKITHIPDFNEGEYFFKTETEIITKNVTVNLNTTWYMTIDVGDVISGENAVVTVNVPADATGNITIELNGGAYALTVLNGQAVFNVGALNAGTYTVIATYSGDEKYAEAQANKTFVVSKASKIDPNIDIAINNVVYPDDVVINISAPASATGMVDVNINGVNYTEMLVDGKATVTISGLAVGNYTAVVAYSGDERYNAVQTYESFSVAEPAKVDPEINVSINNVVYPNDLVINITAPADATGSVNVTVSGKIYYKELVNGMATVTVSSLNAGDYTVLVNYSGDGRYNGYSTSVHANVIKADSSVSVNDTVAEYGQNVVVHISAEGAAGVNATVVESPDAQISYSNDEIIISGLAAGNYTLKVTTIPDNNHIAAVATSKITVNKVNSAVSVEDAVLDYGASAVIPVRADGISSINASIAGCPDAVISYSDDYTISISGLHAGSYTLNVVGVPDKNHYASQDSATITVNKVNSTLSLTDVVFDYGGSGTSSVTLTGATDVTARVVDHDEAIISVEANVITVSGLDAGPYTLAVVTIPDADHSACEATADITVNKVDSTIAVNDASFRYGESVEVPVSVSGAESINASIVGYPDVEISYSADSIVISGLAVGNYTLVVTAIPDRNHNAAQATAKIAVNRVIVTSANFNQYFNGNGEPIGDFPELIFAGDFADKHFNINKPVVLIGENAKFTNVQFNVRADNVSIMNMELNYQGEKSIIDIDGVSNFTLKNNNIVYSTAALKASAISVANSDEVIIKDNTINASGSTFVDGILISDSNFTIDSNKITVSSGVDAEGINMIGSGNGNVRNNDVNVFADRTVYGMNTTANIIVQLKIIFVFNVIYGEGMIAVGINDDSETIDNNRVTLKAVQAIGVIVNSENAKITNNDIKLTSADPEQQDPSLESSATGVQINTKSTVSYNTIDSFDQSISVEGGCATEVSYNNVNAPMTVGEAVGTNIIGNDIGTDKDKAVYISESAVDTVVDDNVLAANGAKGNDAVSNEGTGTTITNNKAKPLLSIDSIADIIEGQSVVIIIRADSNFTDTVNVQVGSYNTNASLIDGQGKVTVGADKLSVGEVMVKVTFSGNANYTNDTANTTFAVKAKTATVIKVSEVITTYGTSKNIVVTLTDASGKALPGKDVIIVLNGASKTLTTDANGQVSYAVAANLAPNTYYASITFNGDASYAKSAGSVKVVVNKAKSVLTAKKKTFKVKKSKKYTITLKSGKKAIGKVKVTLKVKGKTYKSTTNAKGKATFNLKKLTKKGKYTATVKFAGSKYYTAASKKVKITIK